MKVQSKVQSRDNSIGEEVQVDERILFVNLISIVKDVYDDDKDVQYSGRTIRALLEIDLEHTKMARDRVFDEMVYKAVHCATKVHLVEGERDPTLMDFTKIMEILFVK